MAKKFLAAGLLAAGAIFGANGVANAAYINAATNQIESEGGEISIVFNSLSAADSSNLVAVSSGLTLFNNQTAAPGASFLVGSFLAGETVAFQLNNLSKAVSFLTGLAAGNYDNVVHALLTANADGSITVRFEDLPNGGDFDYNDLVFTVYEKVYETPIPAAGALLLTGLAGFGFAGRKRKTAA